MIILLFQFVTVLNFNFKKTLLSLFGRMLSTNGHFL